MTKGRTFPPPCPSCPPHYSVGGIEVIHIIKAKLTPKEFEGHCRANVLKYVFRYPDKGGLRDLDKAIQYLAWLRECVEDQQFQPVKMTPISQKDQATLREAIKRMRAEK